MKEAETLRLVHAFVLSRISYSLPYLRLTQADKSRVEILLRRVYKVALGLPIRTSTERLLALGLNNTLERPTSQRNMRGCRELQPVAILFQKPAFVTPLPPKPIYPLFREDMTKFSTYLVK